MAPPRQGSAFVKAGKIVVQVRLRADAPRRFWVTECPARKDSVPVDLVHARAVAADLQRLYDSGKWDPLAKPEGPAAAPEGPLTVLTFVTRWAARQTYESASKDRRVLTRHLGAAPLGALLVRDLRPMHIVAFIDWLRGRPSRQGGVLAARTVRSIYDAVRRALDEAVLHELLPANPCAPVHGRLPSIEDKSPGDRDGWFFERAEVWALITDPRVPEPRRVAYAVEFLTGCRPGELSALRIRDWDRGQRPLTRLTVSRAIKSVSKTEGRTKTGAKKLVPVHPALERILSAWVAEGWERFIGRAPTAEDLLCPNQNNTPRDTTRANRYFGQDLAKLKLRKRHHYCTRHTFISQTQDDGADASIMRWATHAPPTSAYDGYTRGQWSRLCEEIGKLRVGPEEGSTPPPPSGGEGLTPALTPTGSVDRANALGNVGESIMGLEVVHLPEGGAGCSEVSPSVDNPGTTADEGQTDEDTSGPLTPRLTPAGVDQPHAGELGAYAWLERVEATDPAP